jgi:hypothetical protein
MLVPADQALMHGTRWSELPYEISKCTDFRSAESELSNYSRLVGQLGQPPDEFAPASIMVGRIRQAGACQLHGRTPRTIVVAAPPHRGRRLELSSKKVWAIFAYKPCAR